MPLFHNNLITVISRHSKESHKNDNHINLRLLKVCYLCKLTGNNLMTKTKDQKGNGEYYTSSKDLRKNIGNFN